MKTMFLVEFNRAIRKKSFWLAILVGVGIVIVHFVTVVLPASTNPLEKFRGILTYPNNLYMYWLGGSSTGYYSLYLAILPILIVIPFSLTVYTDFKYGYVKNIVTRTDKKYYFFAKYLVNFIIGGITAALPMILSFCMTASVLPALNPLGDKANMPSDLMGDLYFKHPFMTVCIFIILYFIYGGIYATLPLTGALVIDNILFLSLLPFMIWYILSVISRYFAGNEYFKGLSPSVALCVFHASTTWLVIIVEFIAVIFCSILIYMRKGIKTDVY